MSILGRLKGWRITILALVIAAAALAAIALTLNPFGLNPFAGEDGGALAPTERLIPVRMDTLATEISIYGVVAFTNKEDMTFGSPGYVAEILVSEGEIVSAGQPLARLDPESVADLRRDIAQAQLDHKDALESLEDAEHQTLRIAEAEAAIANAALELYNAREALNDLQSPKQEDIAAAESTLANAELEAQTVERALDELLNPKPEVVASAVDAISQARITLEDAESALGEDAAAAANDLAAAERDLEVAKLNVYALDNTNRLKSATDAYNEEKRDYLNVIYKWTGVNATDDDLAMTPDDLFAALDFDPEQVYDPAYPLFLDGRIADNPNTRWNELKVFGWRSLYPGSSLIEFRCDQHTLAPVSESDTSNTNAELCIQRDMENAYKAFDVARNDLIGVETQYQDSRSSAQRALSAAEKTLLDAQEALDRLTDGNIGAVRLQVKYDKARADYDAAKRNLNDMNNPEEAEVNSKRKQIALAQANRAAASEALRNLLNPNAEEVALKRSQLALAQAKLDQAKLDRQRLADRRDVQIALREGAASAAQAKIDGAARRYEDSTLKAPWDGYIASIPVEEGEEIEPFKIILTVVNTGIVQIEGSVDEIDVLSLQRDSVATVTMDALPDHLLEGVVSSISSTASNQQGVVTFDVKIDVRIPEDITLQEGLSAVAKVSVSEESGLLIPTQAIQYGDAGAYVRMMSEDGNLVDRPITLGSSDGFFAIVESGLSEGDRIVMEVLSDNEFNSNVRFGPGGGRRGQPPEREFDN